MIDTRIIEKKAREIIATHKKMIFRLKLRNGHIVDRIIEEVTHTPDAKVIYYSDFRQEYIPRKNYTIDDIHTIDFNKMIKIGRVSNPTFSTENGTIYHLIEILLKSGYQLIE